MGLTTNPVVFFHFHCSELRYCDDRNAKPSLWSWQSLKTTALQLMAMAHNNGSWLDMADWTALFRS
jgi:hypothetical protein